jgi:hypothetical protein
VTVVAADDLLPVLDVVIATPAAFQKLRRLPMVDYIEPLRARGDIPQWGAVGGCGWGDAWDGEPFVTTRRATSTRRASRRWPSPRRGPRSPAGAARAARG